MGINPINTQLTLMFIRFPLGTQLDPIMIQVSFLQIT